METLVLHPGALGDIVLSLPALDALRNPPPSRLTVAGNLDYLRAACGGVAHKLISLSTLPLHRLYSGGPFPAEDLRIWRSFDRIVSWTGFGDPAYTRSLQSVNAAALVAPWRPGTGDRRHVSRIFLDSLSPWVPQGSPLRAPRIRVPDGDAALAREWLVKAGWAPGQRLVAMHPGAGSPAKRWPLCRFGELVQRLLEDPGLFLTLVEGPAEPGLAGKLRSISPSPRACVAEGLPLNLAAGILLHCAAFVGNDSGIAHLAAAVGAPAVVLFGPTLTENWAPPGATVLKEPSGCSGCAAADGSAHSCLENIPADAVAGEIRRLLQPT